VWGLGFRVWVGLGDVERGDVVGRVDVVGWVDGVGQVDVVGGVMLGTG
jgi:hypothetical protein